MKTYVHAKYNLDLYFTVDADLNEVHEWKVNGDALSIVRKEGDSEEFFPAEAKPSEDAETKPLEVNLQDSPFFDNQGEDNDDEEEDEDNEEDE